MSVIRVVVADDQKALVEEIADGLRPMSDIHIVGVAHDGAEAMKAAQRTRPDVVLMDLDMPVMNGIEATRQIRQEMPECEILVWTVLDDSRNLFEAYKAGAKGYLFKNAANAEIAEGIRMTARGEATIPPGLATDLRNAFERIANQQAALRQLYSVLTMREVEVLTHIGQGEKNRQIAQSLFITEEAVKKHVRAILDKLHVNNRIEAAVIAHKSGLMDSL